MWNVHPRKLMYCSGLVMLSTSFSKFQLIPRIEVPSQNNRNARKRVPGQHNRGNPKQPALAAGSWHPSSSNMERRKTCGESSGDLSASPRVMIVWIWQLDFHTQETITHLSYHRKSTSPDSPPSKSWFLGGYTDSRPPKISKACFHPPEQVLLDWPPVGTDHPPWQTFTRFASATAQTHPPGLFGPAPFLFKCRCTTWSNDKWPIESVPSIADQGQRPEGARRLMDLLRKHLLYNFFESSDVHSK